MPKQAIYNLISSYTYTYLLTNNIYYASNQFNYNYIIYYLHNKTIKCFYETQY